MPAGGLGQSPAGLFGEVPRVPGRPGDVLSPVAVTSSDLGAEPIIVRRQSSLELGFGVVRGHHDAATFAVVGIEAVVPQDPSPDRVVIRVHLRQCDHLRTGPPQ